MSSRKKGSARRDRPAVFIESHASRSSHTKSQVPSAMRRHVLSLALVQAMAVLPLSAMAQTMGPINESNTGTMPDQPGQTGSTPSDITVTVNPGQIVGGATSSPDVTMVSTGGQGSVGTGGTADTGDGGDGGNGGHVQLNIGSQAGVLSNSTADAAVVLSSNGGDGNMAGKMSVSDGIPGKPGSGGSGGLTNNGQTAVTFIQEGTIQSNNGWNGTTPGTTAILLSSKGGDGAPVQEGDAAQGDAPSPAPLTGHNGSDGGNGGDIVYSLDTGSVKSQGAAIVALSQGGVAGAGTGAIANSGDAQGGNGGGGGNGGNGGAITISIAQNNPGVAPTITAVGASQAAAGVSIPIDQNGHYAQAAVLSAGIQVQSLGGVGGAGGTANAAIGGTATAGSGGSAGSGGNITVLMGSTNLSTTGFAAGGVLAQSIGGAGGQGAGAGSIFSSSGGKGGPGGNGGVVSIGMGESNGASVPTSLISTQGDDSMAIVGQSIGGGGGAGGAVSNGSLAVGIAIGGQGEVGGVGGSVSLMNGTSTTSGLVVSTLGEHSSALVAQSVGGGGGSGGSATSSTVGPFNYTVGGTGGSGGDAGSVGQNQVTVLNNGIVRTVGNHAKGVVAQAVGGGGGDGGSAQSFTASAQLNINTTIGGSGGKGGSAGDVLATNDGQILTNGSDAWGLLVQSVSGGGGNGGMSKSDAFTALGPGMSLAVGVTIGGDGGGGGSSGNVVGQNNNLIMTSGAGAHGLLAQSITGGGGNGGDSSALNVAAGQGDAVNVNVVIGGTGGNDGNQGTVTANNTANGTIWTMGEGANAIFAQSIGGGGGQGGSGSGDTWYASKESDKSSSLNLTIGGSGGKGAVGGTVNVTNDGALLTMGDNAHGILAQSVGAGGGLVSGASAKGTALAKYGQNVQIAGANGSAGNGGTINVNNTGVIQTNGGDSAAVYAQSVGGGGGKAGYGATAGLPPTNVTLDDYLEWQSVFGTQVYGGVRGLQSGGLAGLTPDNLVYLSNNYLSYASGNPASLPADSTQGGTVVAIGVGGGNSQSQNATGGIGGTVTVGNTGSLATAGPLSAGIWAQSVGGGGGDGGLMIASQKPGVVGPTMHSIVVLGGVAPLNTGDGGQVTVNNTGAGSISTTGDASFGIFAQSVGGGGGTVSLTSGYAFDGTPSLVALGGSNGSTGNGSGVTVTHSSSNPIATSGWESVGIVAQSIGGGGGSVMLMQTKPSNWGYSTSNMYPQGMTTFGVGVGSNADTPANERPNCGVENNGDFYNACGAGGSVSVTTAGVSTGGRNSHGVLAQSVGGGGGWVIGLTPQEGTPFTKQASMAGPGGNVSVTVNGAINTSGDGAYGVLAQSIGGGGVLGGDLAAGSTAIEFPRDTGTLPSTQLRVGNGGDVTVNVAPGASVSTSGQNAHAVFAQTVGGGGGLWETSSGLMIGSMGGAGHTGLLSINNQGTIKATGNGSSAVYTNSEGNPGTSDVLVNNEASGQIIGNSTAPAVLFSGSGNTNGSGSLTNQGLIKGSVAVGVANGGFIVVNNNAGGSIYGDMHVGSPGGQINNQGYWATGQNSSGAITNNGTMDINAANQSSPGTSTFTGDMVLYGIVKQTADFVTQQATYAQVQGKVIQTENSGVTFSLTPRTLLPNTVPLLGATEGLSVPIMTAQDQGNYLFRYNLTTANNTISVTPVSWLLKTGAPLTSNEQSTAAYLDNGFTSNAGATAGSTYANLSTITNATDYKSALDSLSSESAQAASVARLSASHAFVERMNSCPQFEQGSTAMREHDCVWMRAATADSDLRASYNSGGFSQDTQVVQVGGQREIAPNWFVGGSLSYDQNDLNSHTVNAGLDGNGWSGGLIVKYQMGDWLVSGAVDAGRMSYDAKRYVSVGSLGGYATANFDVQHIGLHSRISRQIPLSGWYMKPYIDLHATHIESDGFVEQGAGGLGLQGNGTSQDVFSAAPMLEAGSRIDFDGGKTLQLYGAIGGAFYSVGNVGADMRLQGMNPSAGTFHVGTELPRQRLKVNLGADFKATDRLNVRLEYNGEFADRYESNGGSIKLNYMF